MRKGLYKFSIVVVLSLSCETGEWCGVTGPEEVRALVTVRS